MIEIQQFTQGSTDITLFALIGPWLSSRAVHVDQDGPITSEPGDMWHVATEKGEAVGFALTHPTLQGAHVKNVYSGDPRARDRLLKDILRMLDDLQVERAYSIGRESDDMWARYGFAFDKRRGAFGTWERTREH